MTGWRHRARVPRWAVAATAIFILVSITSLAVLLLPDRPVEEQYLEVYLADVPGDFEKVQLRIEGVYVGAARHPLHVEVPSLDILQYNGTERSIRVASGDIPRAEHGEVSIVFGEALGYLDGAWLPIAVPNDLLHVTTGFSLGESASSAVLLDLDMDRSLVLTSRGFEFVPHVGTLYYHDYGGDNASAAPRPGEAARLEQGGFQGAEPQREPAQQARPAPPELRNEPAASPRPSSAAPPSGGKPEASAGPAWSARTSSPEPNASVEPSPSPSEAPAESPPASSDPLAPFLPSEPAEPQCGGDEGEECGPEVPGVPGAEQRFIVRLIPENEEGGPELIDPRSGSVMSPDRLVYADQLVAFFGGLVTGHLRMSPIVFADMTEAEALALLQHPEIAYVEPADVPLEFASLPSARVATHWNELEAGASPLGVINPASLPYDGRGVGIAMIDTGVDASHPDLPFDTLGLRSSNAVVFENYEQASAFNARTINTDILEGHGTHVAGLMVAKRSSTQPDQYGLAPGAKLYVWGVGEAGTLYWVTQAFDDLLFRMDHGQFDPPIKVLQNSWSTGPNYDPDSSIIEQVDKVVDRGVVVVFAAGNYAGSGSTNRVSAQCQIPREGVVCVGGFDDDDTGSRESGRLYSRTSRGAISDPETWPDLVAPATDLRSAKPLLTNTGTLGGAYMDMTGTSVAAPLVSATLALMFQVNPGLVPSQAEYILEQTAFPFSASGSYAVDDDYRFDGSHYAKGHGLLDVEAAVERANAEG